MQNGKFQKQDALAIRTAIVIIYLQLLVSSLALVGWAANLTEFKSIFIGFATMKVNAAIGFLFAGLSLLFIFGRQKKLSIGFAIPVLVLAVLSLFQYIFNTSFGIDELFIKDFTTPAVLFPGRIAFATSIKFLLVGVALFCFNSKKENIISIGQITSLLVTLLASVALLGYFFDIKALYEFSYYSTVALHTAILFFLFSFALLFSNGKIGLLSIITSAKKSGVTARRLLTASFLITMIIGWLCLKGIVEGIFDYHIGFVIFMVANFLFSSIYIWWDAVIQRKSEDELTKISNAVEQSGDMIFITDRDGIIQYANNSFTKLTGFTKKEIIGNTPRLLKSEFQDSNYYEKLWGTIIAGKTFRGSPVNRKKNGDLYHVEQTITPILNEHGEITNFISTCKDVTELKAAEREIAKIEMLYRNLFNGTSELIMITSSEGNFLHANHALYKTLGYSEAELSELGLEKIVHPKFISKFKNSIDKLISGETIEDIEIRLLKKDGNPIDVTGSLSSNTDSDSVNRIIFFLKDITLRKQAEIKLRMLTQAIEQSSVSIVITDYNGNIEYVNPFFTELTGYTFAEVEGKNPRFLNSGAQNPGFYSELWNSILAGEIWRGEMYNLKKNGEKYWALAIISPLHDDQGNVSHFVAIEEDITDKKRVFEELVLAKNKAEEMNEIKAYFFANMSHELRTPLIGILGFSEIIKDLSTDEELKSYSETIFVSGKRLLNTLNLILSLSKIEASTIELKITCCDILPKLKDVFNTYTKYAEKSGLEYKFITNEAEIFCNIDEKCFNSIFDNLINNAIKYTPRGSVVLKSFVLENRAIIQVIDTGIGIEKEKQEIVWEEFRQASEGMGRTFEGTGLGLTISKKYTEAMEGNISVESVENSGSTFTVELPIAAPKFVFDSTSSETNNRLDSKKLGETSAELKLKKILSVEDDFIARELLKKILSPLYHLEFVVSAKEALEKVRANNYDGILMDINLRRGMDGVMLTQEIRKLENYKEKPIIAITAFAMEEEKNEFLSKGLSHYISKPFSKKDLLKLMSEVFQE